MPYTVYKIATGEIVKCGTAGIARGKLQVRDDASLAVIEGHYSDTEYRIANGKPELLPVVPPVITADQVKTHAYRLLSQTDWYVVRHAETGEAVPADIAISRQAVRDASDAIEAMDPIPVDYRDPKYWPTAP